MFKRNMSTVYSEKQKVARCIFVPLTEGAGAEHRVKYGIAETWADGSHRYRIMIARSQDWDLGIFAEGWANFSLAFMMGCKWNTHRRDLVRMRSTYKQQ